MKKRFVIMLSLIIGIGVGVMASLLRTLTHWIEDLIQKGFFNVFDGLLYFVRKCNGLWWRECYFKRNIAEPQDILL